MKHPCPNKEENEKDCPCYDTSCIRHGKCTQCQEYHHSDGSKTSCGK